MLSNSETGGTAIADIVSNVGSGEINVLSSLDRSSDGSVTSSTITAQKADLGTQDLVLGTGSDIDGGAITVSAGTVTAGGGTSTIAIVGDAGATVERNGNDVLAGDSYSLDIDVDGGATTFTVSYVARDGDTLTDIAKGLTASASYGFDSRGLGDEADGIEITRSGSSLTFTNNSQVDVDITEAVTTGGTAGGGLELLGDLDVSTLDGAKASLGAFESLIQTSIDAAATFGSSEGRIDIQNEFVSSLSDSLKSGIGALVDANMEEASARLQALQVQQQLAVQSLSIANQAPQSILSLFR